MSKIVRNQSKFTSMVPKLIDKAFELGFHVTLGDAYRDPRAPYGSRSSRHRQRLAIDLNLFVEDSATGRLEYQTSTQAHLHLGEYWESIGGIWGGRFGDGNHYEWPI